MIPTALLTNGVAVISPTAVLPAITGTNTSIDGTTQTVNIGDSNTGNLGQAGTVGVGADGIAGTSDDIALTAVNRPEVQITGASTLAIGLDVRASNTTIRGLSILGFGNGGNNNNFANIRVGDPGVAGGGNYNGILLENNFVGVDARLTNFTTTNTATSNADNIRVIGANGNGATTGAGASIIQNNLIGYANGKGIGLEGNNTLSITSVGFVVRNNEIRNNGIGTNNLDGVDIEYSSGAVVTGNLVIDNAGVGVDMFGSPGSNTISDNTIIGNGRANNENAGVRLFGSGNVVSQNIIRDNVGSGVTVQSNGSNNRISLNSISGNGTVVPNGGTVATGAIGIDLFSSTDNAASGTSTFVTLNDDGDADAGGNGLTNMPVIQGATIRNGTLFLTGFARPGALLEFYIASANAASLNAVGANFGQGQTYLFSRTEGTTNNASATLNDLDATTGSYSGNINGFNQGAETGQNRFSFAIPLSSLTSAQQAALTAANVRLTATATQLTAVNGNQGTSEFSGNAPVFQAPIANNDLASTNVGVPVTINVTGNDQNNIDPVTINLNPNGVAGQTATTYTVAGVGTFTTVGAPAGSVIFTPANNTYTGTVTIPYVVSNTSGTLSNPANISVNIVPAFDLATAITAPTASSVTAGASLTYTVTSTNNSTFAASNVTQTLQLPAGLTNNGGTVTFTVNGSASTTPTYNNATGLVTFTPTAVTLAAGATNTYGVTVSRVPGGGSITATANISSTGNGLESNATNNVAVNTVTVTPAYDVTTTITGPVDNNNAAVSATRGNIVTYTVNTINSSGSASAAPNVGQTVTFNQVLTDVYVSNGGTVSVSGSTTTITFPALASLNIGETVMNTISFVAPTAASYTATATVTANTNNTGDTNTGNNTATLNTTTKAAAGTATDVYTTISSNRNTAVAPGTPVTLTVVAGNNGPATASNVVTQVQLPTGLGGVTVSNGSYNSTTGIVTFNTLALASGATNPATFAVTFNAPTTGPVLATAVISTDNPDLVSGNNSAEIKTEVAGLTDVTTVLAGPASVTVGQTATFSATTANNGPNTAYGVVQTVQLPAGLNNVSFSNAAISSYNSTTGVATFTLAAPLAANTRQVNTVSFTVPATLVTDPAGTTNGSNLLSAVATVSTTSAESSYTNNSALVTTVVTPATDVRVAVTGPSTAIVGNAVTYTMTTTNDGPTTAASVQPTLQLPAGLTNNGGVVTVNGGTYDNNTGLVTFAAITNLRVGGSVSNTVTLAMRDVAELTPVAQAVVSGATLDTDLTNNRASLVTLPATTTATAADLSTTLVITTGGTTPAPGAAMRLTATFRNPNATGGTNATDVLTSVQLPAGLGTVTVSGGGSYNNTTGLVTWNGGNAQTLNANTTLTYTIDFNAPTNGEVRAVSYISSTTTTDPTIGNNVANAVFTVAPLTDVTTSISGPLTAVAGGRVTYAVRTINNGPSVSTNSIAQSVTVPSGVTNLTFPAGSSISGNVITFPAISAEAVGNANAVVNYVSFDAPATNFSVSGTVNMTGDTNTGNNTASLSTSINNAPVAFNVVNTLQPYQGSSAGPLRISPLVATDADNNTLTYTLTSLPAAGTGILYLDAAGTQLAATGVAYSATQVNNLFFDPIGARTVAGATPDPTPYVGNAFFTYTATDNAATPATSNPALYTIQIGRDNASAYTVATAKGGATPYQNGDVIASVLDNNGARYNATSLLTTNGVTSAVTVAPADATQLSNLGLALSTTAGSIGNIVVTDRTKLVNGTYTVNITTVDVNGGTNTLPVTFTIGAAPLPVSLVSFVATAVEQDAKLTWRTAQELNNSHFVVERSFDGATFEAVGTVAGQGTTTQAHDYRFTDARVGAKAQGRMVYYRLRQVDTDGTASTSQPQTVRFAQPASVSVYPNPATIQATLNLSSLPAGTYQVQVLDAAGRLIFATPAAGAQNLELPVATWPNGTYLIKVQTPNQVYTNRLVK